MNFRRRRRALQHAEAHIEGADAIDTIVAHPSVPQGAPELIESREALTEFMGHVRAEGTFAFDTEFIGEETFVPNICLVQLSTRSRIALIDPLSLDDDVLAPVWDAVCDPGLTTIVHAGGQDIGAAQRRTNRQAQSIVDTQVAAGFLGMPWPTSLANVVLAMTNLRLSKGHTFTEWDSRPLSKSQLAYAADDVRYLPLVWQLQRERLDSMNRTSWVIRESEESLRTSEVFDPESHVRRAARGLGLRPRVMTIVRELVILRYAIAQAKNLPPRTILPDGPLLEIARNKFTTTDELAQVRSLPRATSQEFGGEILRVIHDARQLPIEHDRIWITPEESADDRTRIDALWSIITMRAISLGIATPLVLTRAQLARWFIARSTSPTALFPADSWRDEAVGRWLGDFLDGRETLKVGWQAGGLVAR